MMKWSEKGYLSSLKSCKVSSAYLRSPIQNRYLFRLKSGFFRWRSKKKMFYKNSNRNFFAFLRHYCRRMLNNIGRGTFDFFLRIGSLLLEKHRLLWEQQLFFRFKFTVIVARKLCEVSHARTKFTFELFVSFDSSMCFVWHKFGDYIECSWRSFCF